MISEYQQIWKTQQCPQDCKNCQFSLKFPKKGNAKECSDHPKIAHISHAAQVMLKILLNRFHQ